MNSNDAFEFKDKGLKALIKALGESSSYAKVGILGGGKARTEGDTNSPLTNAEIGAKHEFGNDGMPTRSFLRVPIQEKMQKYLDESKLFDVDLFKSIFQEKNLDLMIKKIGIVGVSIVLDAFETAGFGKWPKSNMERKKVKMTLVETQQLRNSISSEVSK